MRIIVDTRDPRLSPGQRIALQNIATRIAAAKPKQRPLPSGVQESLDEALGDAGERNGNAKLTETQVEAIGASRLS